MQQTDIVGVVCALGSRFYVRPRNVRNCVFWAWCKLAVLGRARSTRGCSCVWDLNTRTTERIRVLHLLTHCTAFWEMITGIGAFFFSCQATRAIVVRIAWPCERVHAYGTQACIVRHRVSCVALCARGGGVQVMILVRNDTGSWHDATNSRRFVPGVPQGLMGVQPYRTERTERTDILFACETFSRRKFCGPAWHMGRWSCV